MTAATVFWCTVQTNTAVGKTYNAGIWRYAAGHCLFCRYYF